MKNKLILFLSVLISHVGMTQSILNPFEFSLDSNQQMSFGFVSEGYSNSTALSGRATSAGLFGGYISREDRQYMIDRASDENNTGNFFNTAVYFNTRLTDSSSLFFQVTDRQEANAAFSKNTLQLVLFGNKQFAGQSIELTPLDYNQYHYNQIQVGYQKTFPSKARLSIAGSFLYGQQQQSLDVDRLSLFTEDNGTQISGMAQLELNQSDPGNANLWAYNGYGASIDLWTEFPIKIFGENKKPATFSFGLTDVGFIQWNGNSQKTKASSYYEYEGVLLPNLFNLEGDETNLNPGDYLDSVTVVTRGEYTSNLPFTINVSFLQEWGKSTAQVGFTHRNNANYYPFFYGKYGYSLSQTWQLFGQINYGGYGKLGGGLELAYHGEHHVFRIGSTNLEGFINPDKWAGQSIYLQLGFIL